MSKFDLTVAYRIYPGIPEYVPVFQTDKLKLTEFGLKSFLNAIGGLKVKFYAILDTCPVEYKETVLRNFPDAVIIEGTKLGNFGSFEKQIEILLNQTESQAIYFAEDDYFYLPDSLEMAMNFFEKHNPDFLTLYYTPEYMSFEIHNIFKPEGINFENRFWQRVGSTTLTFLTTKQTLQATKNVFMSFTKRNYDASLWFSLTKRGIFHPKFYKPLFDSSLNYLFPKLIAKIWLYNGLQAVFGRKYSLYAPFPSLATHLNKNYLPPNVRWYELFDYFIDFWNISR
ncbi:MAG: hypothetical protein CH6_0469 [Candidatus Kapaibacterium sp.]|nr:MAG: hypothetical protein CH6_0469 [Candidatus Kapabacteria bacterium]